MTYDVDVAILGGAFSGASAGLLLKRAHPELKVLIIERSTEPDRKVGESTSEVAGCFLTRELRLFRYLSQNHLNKQGLRLWFTTPENDCMGRCGEIGPYYQSRLPTYQIDRATLDPHILEEACLAGCDLWKPARVAKLELGGQGNNLLEVKMGDETKQVRAKWVIDASGKAAVIARQRKTWRQLGDHPTNSVWARFRGVKDLDGYDLAARFPEFAKALPSPRGVATNHLMGHGWWCWIIPLKDGDVSVGITYDPRIFSLPEGKSLAERLHAHVIQHPVGRELFAEATAVPGDSRAYSHLPYYSEEVAGDGWVICGDAGGFMDPLYSQGLDFCGHTVYVCQHIVGKALMDKCVRQDIAEFNERFRTAYFRWYRALYREKYHYLGDLELMWAAFLLDIGTYFIGPVRLVYDLGEEEWLKLPYFGRVGGLFAGFMRLYNRRLAVIGRKRLAAGCYGRMNLDRRMYVKQGFSPDMKVFKLIRKGVWQWLKCEWHALFLRPIRQQSQAAPAPAPAVASASPGISISAAGYGAAPAPLAPASAATALPETATP
jgi:flavin-dependent dehydrogenase